MSKSIASKTHTFLRGLGLNSLGEVRVLDGVSAQTKVMRRSVREFKQSFGRNKVRIIGGFRLVYVRNWRRAHLHCSLFALYDAVSGHQYGNMTIEVCPNSQVALAFIDHKTWG